ncbi:MAG: hypothetical protein Q8P31_03980 [Bacillota bacterium]|nr:hypothetical protein [Bacillota bacterium]
MARRRRHPPGDEERLAAMLGFSPADEYLGLDLSPGETGGLLATAETLAAWTPEPPAPEQQKRLLAAAMAAAGALAAPRLTRPRGDLWTVADGLWAVLDAVRPHVHVFRAPFWLATLVAVAAGLPLLAGSRSLGGWLDLDFAGFLVLMAPVVAVGGTAYAFRSCGSGMAELEMTAPLTPWQLIAGRLAWVLAYDSLLLGLCSVAAAATGPGLALGYLVAAWLGPMLALALADLLLTSILQPWAAAGACLGLWAGAVACADRLPWMAPLAAAGTAGAFGSAWVFAPVCAALLAALALSGQRLAARLAGLAPQAGG